MDSYGVFELFDGTVDPYIRNTLHEFVYRYIIPEESPVISSDDFAEYNADDEENTYCSDEE
jgi:hypothetical protein